MSIHPQRHVAHAHNGPAASPPRAHAAFSLVEILIVVMIMSILATVVFTAFGSATEDARAAAAQTDLKHLQTKVGLHAQQNHGALPADITEEMLADWFGSTLRHPYSITTTPLGVEVDASGDATVTHPSDKLIAGALRGWWYNPANGVVRSRVRDLGNAAASLDLYREVNITSIGGLNDIN